MHIPYPALITVLQSLPHVPHHLLIYVTSIQPRGLLEVGEFGFVLQELDESGRRLREDLPSAPNSLTITGRRTERDSFNSAPA